MKIGTRFGVWTLALVGAACLAVPAHADIIFNVDSVFAVAGTTGNSLDVTLTNSGATPIQVGTFTFVISTTDTDISFTSTNTNTTDPYIFAGDTLGGNINFVFTSPGQSMDGSDFALTLTGDTVGAGATVGLGHVLFDVSPGAVLQTATVTLSQSPADTSLAGPASDGSPNIPIDKMNNGQITIVATPEPNTVALLGVGLLGVLGLRRRALGRR